MYLSVAKDLANSCTEVVLINTEEPFTSNLSRGIPKGVVARNVFEYEFCEPHIFSYLMV